MAQGPPAKGVDRERGARVRIPSSASNWPVGQVAKTPPFHGGNTGLESRTGQLKEIA